MEEFNLSIDEQIAYYKQQIVLLQEKKASMTWRERLANDVLRGKETEIADLDASVDYGINLLKDREKETVLKIYKDGMTLQKIADGYGVSKSRIGAIKVKSLRKLRHPKFGILGYDQRFIKSQEDGEPPTGK